MLVYVLHIPLITGKVLHQSTRDNSGHVLSCVIISYKRNHELNVAFSSKLALEMFALKSLVVPLLFLGCCSGMSVQGTERSDTVGGRVVFVSTVAENWFKAKNICLSKNMILLEILDANENIEAQNLLTFYALDNAWIGADDLAEDDEFHWQSGIKVNKAFWAPGSWDGKGGEQDCVAIAQKPKHPNWYDRECENEYPFICQSVEQRIIWK